MFNISPLKKTELKIIHKKIDQKTKPLGALGDLETLAIQLALITGTKNILIKKPTMLIFAGDHGIAKEGVSIADSEVTQQMVSNFINGGAAINCFCRTNNIALKVIDAGILTPIENTQLIQSSLGLGTKNFSRFSAMPIESVKQGLKNGADIVYKDIKKNCNTFAFGEMGIGNTTSASALMHVLTNITLDDCVGRGTGINDKQLLKKKQLIEKALLLHQENFLSVDTTLAAIGGFEIIQMAGGMLAAAEKHAVILVDGFISSVAALVAIKINPLVKDYMIFSHQSDESGHKKLLDYLNVKPLLSLSMRLGEGTGAAMAMPIIRCAESFYNNMASFESAGVSEV